MSVPLNELTALKANWDGYGALPIDRTAAKNAENALLLLLRRVPAPEVSPNPNGTVSFEWITEKGEAHLEIGWTKFSFFAKPTAGQAVLAERIASGIPDELGALIAAIVYPSD